MLKKTMLFSTIIFVTCLLVSCKVSKATRSISISEHKSEEQITALSDTLELRESERITTRYLTGGKTYMWILAGRKDISNLYSWLDNLSFESIQFEDNKRPHIDTIINAYHFTMDNGEFAYINNGDAATYILYKDNWYRVKNPSLPPEKPTPPRVTENSKVPVEYTSEMAILDGCYVNLHGIIGNDEVMDTFINKVQNKESAFARHVEFTIEGDPIITDFSYDSKEFTVTRDTTRDKFGSGSIKSYHYKNLVIYEDENTELYESGKITYYFLTNLSEINKYIFDNGFSHALLKYD